MSLLVPFSLPIRPASLRKLLLVWLSVCATGSAWALETVSLQLRWRHQFQFAGYYAALHQGYYREAGLDVTLKEGGPDAYPVADVLAGHSDFGIGISSLVIDFLQGKPVLILGPVFQHSPNILLVHGQNQRLMDLAGNSKKKIALMGGDQDVELLAMFFNEGIARDKLQVVPNERHLDDLLDRRIDALNGYISNEPFLLNQRGIPYTILEPRTYGIDFYGDVLFTRKALQEDRPEVVAAFRAASMRGWQYALQNQSEVINLILERYNTQHKSREHLAYEAKELYRLINPSLIEIGHNNPGRWQHIANAYQRFGLVKFDRPLDDFFFQERSKASGLGRMVDMVYWAAISTVVLLVVGAIAWYFHRIHRHLTLALEEKSQHAERYQVFFQHVGSAGMVWREGYLIIDWNRQAEMLFGWKREEVLGKCLFDILLPSEERQRWIQGLANVPEDQDLPRSTHDSLARDGRVIPCEWSHTRLQTGASNVREYISLATPIANR